MNDESNKLLRPFFGRCLRAPVVIINYICRLIINPNIGWLLLFLLFFFIVGVCFHYKYVKNRYENKYEEIIKISSKIEKIVNFRQIESICPFFKIKSCENKIICGENISLTGSFVWSVSQMFDFSSVLKSIDLNGYLSILSILLFLFTWLIGGGGLIGSIVTTLNYLNDGGWRRWPWLLHNHTVILGWSDNGVTVIREHIESKRIENYAYPERIIILTNKKTKEVERKIKTLLNENIWQRFTVLYDVYCGEFDDLNEINKLNILNANAIYVLGETGDKCHDARVLMIPNTVKDVNPCKNTIVFSNRKTIKMELHLDSFGLYSQQIRMDIQDAPTNNKIKFDKEYRNFYDSWAKRLFANYWASIKWGETNSLLRDKSQASCVHLAIVGFSEMGQALAVQAARVAHYDDNISVYITVFDDEIEKREKEFRLLFPRIDEIEDIHFTFIYGDKLGSESFIKKIIDFSDRGDSFSIAIACDDSAMGMKLAIPILNKTKEFPILLRQEVAGRIMLGNEKAPVLMPRIRVFGMMDGAGFNAWFRDKEAAVFYCFWDRWEKMIKDKNNKFRKMTEDEKNKLNEMTEDEKNKFRNKIFRDKFESFYKEESKNYKIKNDWDSLSIINKCKYTVLFDVIGENSGELEKGDKKILNHIRKAYELLDDIKFMPDCELDEFSAAFIFSKNRKNKTSS